ncbi:serine/threonine-protein kinase [Streptomyces tsukubensis]|uniref:serine/threonine-protein kinase n=1 Tax=Streptomyces tsukubensis TaxID=83656 RepID=UPI001D042C26|nr:serine/threonine-protein kinase [Streptomyces tsukubensis]
MEKTIGEGGMGVVWLAWDETLRRRVAVKCARPDDGEAAKRLKKEAQYAARLHHPNIVPVFDFVEEESACWIVMEYVPSRSLAQLVRESGLLTPEDAGSIGCQIAAALARSHTEGVVHGDVTPENVLVTEEGVARLMDFGIARALWSDATQTHTVTGTVRGKPKYLAPEVAKGEHGDEKADVFSLGASLYAAVKGRSPYGEAEHPMAYLVRAIEGHIETPEGVGPLAAPLTELLTPDPRHRPGAAEAYKLLTRAAPPSPNVQELLRDGHTLPLSLGSLTLRLPRPLRRRRRTLALSAVTLIAVAALTTGLVVFLPGDDKGATKDATGESGQAGTDAKSSTSAAVSGPGTAGAIGVARTADPCALLDAPSLSRFGDTERDPSYGRFERCDVLVKSKGGNEVAGVQVDLDKNPAEFGDDVSTRRVGNVTVGTMPRDGDECVRVISTADSKQIVVVAERYDSPSPDPCRLADAATDHAVSVLDRGAVPRRTTTTAANSLARLDACDLLDAAALKRLPGVDPRDPEPDFGDWGCDWSSPDGATGAQLVFNRDNDLSDDGDPTVVAGRRSYVSPRESGDDDCVVRTPHRSYTNSVGDETIEHLMVTVHGPGSAGRLCDTAKALATTATENVTKDLKDLKGRKDQKGLNEK